MAIVDVALARTSNPSRTGHDGVAKLVNAYVKDLGPQAKHGITIEAFPGLRTFATLINGGESRAHVVVNTTLYAVSGPNVYSVDTSGTATLLGSIEGSGLVTMAANRRQPDPQIGIVVSDGLYYIVENNILTQVSDPDLQPPIAIFERDGYFIFVHRSGRFSYSAINDGTMIDGLDFATAESRADLNVTGATRGTDNLIFGTQTLEFWRNTGDADAPFERIQSVNIGAYSAGSVAEVTAVINKQTVDSVAWAATDEHGAYLGIMLLSGYSAIKISEEAQDRALRDEPDPLTIRSMTFSEEGHTFYVITGSSFSWAYDTTLGSWSERKSYGLPRWRAQSYAQFAGKHIVGDYATNTLYEMRSDLSDEAGSPLVMTVQTPPVHAFPFGLQHHALYVDATPGVGLNSASPELLEPQMLVDWSDDGGATWSGQRSIALGREGERAKRIMTRRLGQARSRTYRLTVSAAVVRTLSNAKADVTQLVAA